MQNDDGAELLALIAGREPRGYFDVRTILPDGEIRQRFFSLVQRDHALAHIDTEARSGDVYIGCAPRNRHHGGKAAVPRAWALWCDLDSEDAARALSGFRYPPTLTIASGSPGRLHCWWSSRAPIPAAWVERANRRLALRLGADPVCAEIARVLRVPGTANFKHDPPAPVVVSSRQAGSYSLAELVAGLDDPQPKAVPPRRKTPRRDTGPDALLGISALEYVPRLSGSEPNAHGKAKCPLHEDWSPSLMCYSDPRRGFYCYQCGAGGNIYNFAAKLWGLSTEGADFRKVRERLLLELR